MALGWTLTATSLLSARAGHAAFGFNNRLFVVGGTKDFTNPLPLIESAVVNSDGTIGTPTVTATLPSNVVAGRVGFGFAQKANIIYLVGGTDATGAASVYADCAVGRVDPSGNILWSVGPSLPVALGNCELAVCGNGWLYCIGGVSSVVAPTAQISATGGTQALGSVVGNAATLTFATHLLIGAPTQGSILVIPASSTLATTGPHASNAGIYVVGAGATTSSVPVTKVRDIAATTVTAPVAQTAVAPLATNDVQLRNDVVQTNPVQAAKIQSDGSLGPWQNAGTFPGASPYFNILGHSVLGTQKFIYIIGGQPLGVSGQQLIYRGRPDAGSGTNIIWDTQPVGASSVPCVFGACPPSTSTRVILAAGSTDGTAANGQNKVEEIALSGDGNINFSLGESQLPAVGTYGAVCVIGSYVIYTGGENSSGTPVANLYTAKLQSDVSL
jgi:hypothetical protein